MHLNLCGLAKPYLVEDVMILYNVTKATQIQTKPFCFVW